MRIGGVIFDMGGTLLHFEAPGTTWEDTESTAARGVYRCLQQAGLPLPPEDDAVAAAAAHSINVWRTLDQQAMSDLKLAAQVRLIASVWGVDGLSAESVEAMAAAYMRAVRAHVTPTVGAQSTLRHLCERGLRLGLVSNTHWPAAVHLADLAEHDLARYFDHTVFSSDVDVWKPDPRVFHFALAGLGLASDETVYVGDSLYWDIWGAQQTGMRAVWIVQPSQVVPAGITIQPDATIHRLPELIAVLREWEVDV